MKYILIISVILLFSCNRKSVVQSSIVRNDSTLIHINDSLIEVNHTLSQAYEEMIKTYSETGVVFDTRPVVDTASLTTGGWSTDIPPVRFGGSFMPHIIIRPDGTKEFSGPIKAYNDKSATEQRRYYELTAKYDSLNSRHNALVASYSSVVAKESKKVKNGWPWIVWFVLGAVSAVVIRIVAVIIARKYLKPVTMV